MGGAFNQSHPAGEGGKFKAGVVGAGAYQPTTTKEYDMAKVPWKGINTASMTPFSNIPPNVTPGGHRSGRRAWRTATSGGLADQH